MYSYLDPAARKICEAIDAVEPTTPDSIIRQGCLNRIAEIDQNLTQIKLALITYNDAESSIHEFGVSAEEATAFLAGRRDRLVKFLDESGLDDPVISNSLVTDGEGDFDTGR